MCSYQRLLLHHVRANERTVTSVRRERVHYQHIKASSADGATFTKTRYIKVRHNLYFFYYYYFVFIKCASFGSINETEML